MIKSLEEIKETLFAYVESRVELIQYEIRARLERGIVILIYSIMALALGLSAMIMLLALGAELINQWLKSRYAGYLIFFGLFSLLLILVLSLRESIQAFITRTLIQITKAAEQAKELKESLEEKTEE